MKVDLKQNLPRSTVLHSRLEDGDEEIEGTDADEAKRKEGKHRGV